MYKTYFSESACFISVEYTFCCEVIHSQRSEFIFWNIYCERKMISHVFFFSCIDLKWWPAFAIFSNIFFWVFLFCISPVWIDIVSDLLSALTWIVVLSRMRHVNCLVSKKKLLWNLLNACLLTFFYIKIACWCISSQLWEWDKYANHYRLEMEWYTRLTLSPLFAITDWVSHSM